MKDQGFFLRAGEGAGQQPLLEARVVLTAATRRRSVEVCVSLVPASVKMYPPQRTKQTGHRRGEKGGTQPKN